MAEEARCGTLAVWEDREARRGRTLDLNILVLPATGRRRAPDPIFLLAGGPGQAATELASYAASMTALRRERDMVLVDQRGTGRSQPLRCDLYGAGSASRSAIDPRLLAGDLFPVTAVERCRERLEQAADLKLYSTAIAMDDLDQVRAALGYEKINLFGGSYGSRAAQVYLRRHPESVRSVALEAVAPVDEPLPLHHAYAGQRAIDLVLAECAADRACHAAFPRAGQELREIFARLDRGVAVRVKNPAAGASAQASAQRASGQASAQLVEIVPTRGLIAEGLRYMCYDETVGRLPLAIHRAYLGDLAPLVNLALGPRAALGRELAVGMAFSVTCAEDLPFIDAASAARETAGTLLGDYRIRQQQAACTVWPRGPVPPDVHEPVRSNVPVLLLSSELDPATPPEFGARVAKGLPNSLHVVFPHSGHGVGGPCAGKIEADFFARASVAGLDASCAARTPRIRFTLH